jgi:5-methyltetrahydrofolate--homocysteine methyltransferase
MMLEGAGFKVIDLGVDVSVDTFVAAVKEHNPEILALSALLTTTMGQQCEVINALVAANLRSQVKVIVGGAPVTQAFCDKIGADGYSADAAEAAELAKALIRKNSCEEEL